MQYAKAFTLFVKQKQYLLYFPSLCAVQGCIIEKMVDNETLSTHYTNQLLCLRSITHSLENNENKTKLTHQCSMILNDNYDSVLPSAQIQKSSKCSVIRLYSLGPHCTVQQPNLHIIILVKDEEM